MQLMTEKKGIIITRIEKIVKELMQYEELFQEYLNQEDMVNYLLKSVKTYLTEEQFNNKTDEELKEIFDKIMMRMAISESFKDLTPEQIAIFDEAIKRK